MGCCHPYSGFETGRLTENGKKEIVLERSSTDFLSLSSCEKRGFHPLSTSIFVRNGVPGLVNPIPIPCGQCVGCRMSRARDWTTRLILENREHPFSYFLTLTYKDSCLPQKDGRPSLRKSDLQLFMKRFRYNLYPGKVRFFACGEYGDHTFRPHYHVILFMDHELGLNRFGKNLYHSPVVSRCWPFGLHELSLADSGCFAYVAGYCVKKQKSDLDAFPEKPFILMSRRPGIGALNLNPDEFKDLSVYLEKGKKVFVPSFIRKKLPFYEELKEDLVASAKGAEALALKLGDYPNLSALGEARRTVFNSKIKKRLLI